MCEAYEYGVLVAWGEHESTDTAESIIEAMQACAELEMDWSGEPIGRWEQRNGEITAATSDPHERWYIRPMEA